eukprot:188453-Chlamydomonas_euryale.AAC.6
MVELAPVARLDIGRQVPHRIKDRSQHVELAVACCAHKKRAAIAKGAAKLVRKGGAPCCRPVCTENGPAMQALGELRRRAGKLAGGGGQMKALEGACRKER